MLLAVDVGNTQTHIGCFDGERLVRSWRFATRAEEAADELAVRIAGLFGLAELEVGAVDGAIVSTVVPALGPRYERLIEGYGASYLEVGPPVKTGMPIRVDNPRELGADRLVNAVAAHDRFGGPCVAVDLGTSTNFDAVSVAGEYLGGVIGPGLSVSLEALGARTAKLPRVDLAPPPAAIGRDTVTAMQSGFVHGFAGLIDGINRRIAAELDGEPTCVATGGLAGAIAGSCETIDEIDELLTLRGLRLIWERNR